jgi:hypothetical protein
MLFVKELRKNKYTAFRELNCIHFLVKVTKEYYYIGHNETVKYFNSTVALHDVTGQVLHHMY